MYEGKLNFNYRISKKEQAIIKDLKCCIQCSSKEASFDLSRYSYASEKKLHEIQSDILDTVRKILPFREWSMDDVIMNNMIPGTLFRIYPASHFQKEKIDY